MDNNGQGTTLNICLAIDSATAYNVIEFEPATDNSTTIAKQNTTITTTTKPPTKVVTDKDGWIEK